MNNGCIGLINCGGPLLGISPISFNVGLLQLGHLLTSKPFCCQKTSQFRFVAELLLA